jgi:hypothetical protein
MGALRKKEVVSKEAASSSTVFLTPLHYTEGLLCLTRHLSVIYKDGDCKQPRRYLLKDYDRYRGHMASFRGEFACLNLIKGLKDLRDWTSRLLPAVSSRA